MKYVEVIADAGSADTVAALAETVEAQDFRLGVTGDDGMQMMRLLVADHRVQEVLDTLQNLLGAQLAARIIVLPVETSLPRQEDQQRKEEHAAVESRESLYNSIQKGAQIDTNYLVLVLLSTVVAAIGLIENNVAVIVGAMVIAPLLGPNLALSLGTALGDIPLMTNAVRALALGIVLAVSVSIGIGYLWPSDFLNPELLSRTRAGLDAIVLALASGAAAALSLSTGLSTVLVGVMVAVALLPPATTLGLMLGSGQPDLATGAGLLLAINIVCVNLASKLVFYIKGVRPRTWLEKTTAKKAMTIYVVVWLVTLAILVAIVVSRPVLVNG